jgi:hypothetical protein
VLTLAAVCFVYRVYEPAAAQNAIAIAAGAAVIACVAYVRYGLGFPWTSATVAYLALFWTFHYGLAFTGVIWPSTLQNVDDWELAWLDTPNARLVLLLAVIGAAGFVCGAAPFAPSASRRLAEPSHDGDVVLCRVGWATLLVGLVLSAVFLARFGGLALFSMGYMQLMRDVVGQTFVFVSIDLTELGCLLAICGEAQRRCLRPLIAWAPFGAFMMLLGLRNEAMVPMVAFVIVLARRGVHFRRAVVAAGLLAVLVIVPAVRQFRLVGFSNRSEVQWTDDSPLTTLTELGGTLHAATAYVDWIESGDPYLLGASYWAPIDRQFLRRLIPWHQVPALEDDTRVPSRNIERVGAIGLSSTGEAYYNFGPFGPFIFYAAVGFLFGWLERRSVETPYRAALLGVAMLLLFFNIRDSWLPVPGRAAVAVGVLAGCYALSLRRQAGCASH